MGKIRTLLKGVLIGAGGIMPGVSGGTLAMSLGEYEPLVDALAEPGRWRKSVRSLWPLALGGLLGVACFAFGLQVLLERFPLPTLFGFVGLVLGGVPLLWQYYRDSIDLKNGNRWDIRYTLIYVAFFAMTALLPFLRGGSAGPQELSISLETLLALASVGLLSSTALVIPGVSGSVLLMLLGYYSPLLRAATGAMTALARLDFYAFLQSVWPLMVFGLGIAAGLVLVAKAVRWLLACHRAGSYAAVLGMATASPLAMLCEGYMLAGGLSAAGVFMGLLAMAAGFAVAFRLGRRKAYA